MIQWVLRWHQLGMFAVRMGTSTPFNWLGTLNPSPGLLSNSPEDHHFTAAICHQVQAVEASLLRSPVGRIRWKSQMLVETCLWIWHDVGGLRWQCCGFLGLSEISQWCGRTLSILHQLLGKMKIEKMKGTCKMKIQNWFQVWLILMISWGMF